MRSRIGRAVLALLMIIGIVGSFAVMPTTEVSAGSNGQQITFYNYSGYGSISWLKVYGQNNANNWVPWERYFNPPVGQYGLSGWWWKGQTTIWWRMNDGRSGSCVVNIPANLAGKDWVQVGVARGTSCYFSY